MKHCGNYNLGVIENKTKKKSEVYKEKLEQKEKVISEVFSHKQRSKINILRIFSASDKG